MQDNARPSTTACSAPQSIQGSAPRGTGNNLHGGLKFQIQAPFCAAMPVERRARIQIADSCGDLPCCVGLRWSVDQRMRVHWAFQPRWPHGGCVVHECVIALFGRGGSLALFLFDDCVHAAASYALIADSGGLDRDGSYAGVMSRVA